MCDCCASSCADHPAPRRGRRRFALRQLHGISGLFPIGAFLLLQLWAHSKALNGPEAHARALGSLSRLLPGLWCLLVLVPLVLHGVFGVMLVLRSEYSLGRYPGSRNWMYVLQRITAIVALLFIGWHLINFWLPIALSNGSIEQLDGRLVARMSAATLSVPWFALGYMIGLAGCALHFANGLWSFSVRCGIVVTRRARSRLAWLAALLGAALFAWGANTVVFLATGWRMVGAPPSTTPTTTVCDTPEPAAAHSATAASSSASVAVPSSSASAPTR